MTDVELAAKIRAVLSEHPDGLSLGALLRMVDWSEGGIRQAVIGMRAELRTSQRKPARGRAVTVYRLAPAQQGGGSAVKVRRIESS